MVHKKYTTKSGKTYGPYLYENKRIGDRVVTKYMGKGNSNKSSQFWAYFLIALGALFFIFSSSQVDSPATGRATLDIESITYGEGELITGAIKFNLKEGEFIPADSLVKIKLDGINREAVLRDLVESKPLSGSFYAENSEISGIGEGYGNIGEYAHHPEITFQIKITDSEGNESIIDGKVSKGNDFVYDGEYSNFEIVDGSVFVDGEPADYSSILFDDNNDEIRVTTNYEEIREGYGKDYLGDYSGSLDVVVDNFNITAKDDILSVTLLYDEEVIASAEKMILVGDNSENEDISLSPSEDLAIIKEISLVKIPYGREVTLDLSKYFSGATSYSFESSDIIGSINGEILTLSADEGFKGTRSAKIVAYNGDDKLESNTFDIVVSSGNVNVQTSRSSIKLGESVKWSKSVTLDSPEQISIELPNEAENVEVNQIDGENQKEVISTVSTLTGNVVIEIDLKNKSQKNEFFLTRFFRNIFNGITGNVVSEVSVNDVLPSDEIVKEVTISDQGATEYIIEYETPAPEAFEELTDTGKTVVISAPDELGYTDVLSFTDVPEVYSVSDQDKIRVYWVEGQIQMPFDAYDLDNNGLIDYVEWITPHLSNQTFEIILISKAQHLGSNKEFISDVYSEVSALDGVYYTIPAGDYARVTFERSLSSRNDITLQARSSGQAQVEVYEKDGNTVLMSFDISSEGEYKKYLSNLVGQQDTFDLKVVGNIVDFDLIIDPTPAQTSSGPNVFDSYTDFGGGDVVWEYISYLYGEDGNYAYINFTDSSQISNGIHVNDFGFNIPNGSTINGVKVELLQDGLNTNVGYGEIVQGYVVLTDDNGDEGSDQCNILPGDPCNNWDTAGSYVDYGNASTKWSLALTPDMVNDVDFGFTMYDFGSGTISPPLTVGIDNIRMTVYYTPNDTLIPYVTIHSPNTTYTTLPILVNVTLDEPASNVRYTINDGVTNFTMSSTNNINYNASINGISEGTYTLKVFANDANGNTNYTESKVFSYVNTSLSDCKNLSVPNVVYTLQNNISNYVGTCFNITADNITLNGNGYSLLGSNDDGTYTVFSSSLSNITIKNLIILNEEEIYATKGIYIENSQDYNLINNSIWTYQRAVDIQNSFRINIINNTLYTYDSGGQHALNMQHSNYNIISNNNFSTSTGVGINLDSSNYNNFSDNKILTIPGSSTRGVVILNSSNNIFTRVISTTAMIYDLEILARTSDYNTFIDSTINKYFINSTRNRFVNSTYGELLFTSPIDQTGSSLIGNYSSDIRILNNSVYVNSSKAGLNISANITLRSLPTNFVNPKIFKDGSICTNCYNFTSLNAGTVVFNVSSWSNYSIAEGPNPYDITSCGVLNVANAVYTLRNNISGSCLTLTANNITINGNGYNITGDVVGTNNVFGYNFTIKNAVVIGDLYSLSLCGASRGDGGHITIINSSVRDVYSNGGDCGNIVPQIAGYGGNITVINSLVRDIYSIGGEGQYISIDGGYGGDILLINSSASSVTLDGGIGDTYGGNDGEGGYGGILTSVNSNITSFISSKGGFGDISSGNGGDAYLTNTRVNFSPDSINLSEGSGQDSFYNGLLVFNQSSLYNEYGEIKFSYISEKYSDLSAIVTISSNYTNIDSDNFPSYNISANVTLYGIYTSFTNPVIYRAGTSICSSTSTPSCSNFTSLNAGTVLFNVSSWSNYFIGESPFSLTDCATLVVPGVYTLQNDIIDAPSSCFVVGQDIILNGNGHSIDGDLGGTGISATGPNVTIKNFRNISEFGAGISGNEAIFDNLTLSSNTDAISLSISTAHNILRNINLVGNNRGIYSYQSSNNTYQNLTSIDSATVDWYSMDALWSYNIFMNSNINTYNLPSGHNNYFNDSRYGQIYIDGPSSSGVNLMGNSNSILVFNNNSVYINSSVAGFNGAMNITLYGNPSAGKSIPIIKKNGTICTTCINSTALTDEIVRFTVAGPGNYTIGDAAEVTACGTLDSPNTVYILSNNISASSDCFTITADNITLDGNGYTVDSTAGTNNDWGIAVSGVSNIVLKNLTISDFGSYYVSNGGAVRFIGGVSSSIIRDLHLENNYHGVFLSTGTSNNIVTNVNAIGNDRSLYLYQTSNNNLSNIHIPSGGSSDNTGVSVIYANGNNFNNITISDNFAILGNAGLTIINSNNNVFNRTSVSNNPGNTQSGTFAGVKISGSAYNMFYDLTSVGNKDGIYLNASSNNTFVNSLVNDNSYGFLLYYSYDNNISGGILSNNNLDKTDTNTLPYLVNDNDGLFLLYSAGNTISNLSISNQNNYGLYLKNSQNNDLIDNSVVSSGSHGLALDAADDNFIKNFVTYDNVGFPITTLDDVTGTTIEYNNTYGNIIFTNLGTFYFNGDLTFPGNIDISSNSAYYLVDSFLGPNITSNIYLYGTPSTGKSIPVIKKNGAVCTDCYNFTSLTASTVVFNVTSAGNYTIGDAAEVTACGTLDRANTVYNLQNDVYYSASYTDCFYIQANNITFNGNGHSIIDLTSGSNGISADSSGTNPTIKNVSIYYFNYGLSLTYANGATVRDVLVSNTSVVGISLSNVHNFTIEKNTLMNSVYGIIVYFTGHNGIIRNNYISSSSNDGVSVNQILGARSNLTIANNTLKDNLRYGLYLLGVQNSTAIDNTISNSSIGIYLNSFSQISINNLLVNNTIVGKPGFASIRTDNYTQSMLYSNSYGSIYWSNISYSNITSNLTFPGTISIFNNSVYTSSDLSSLNRSANITLYGTPSTGKSIPVIKKNGNICTDCYNFTNLTAAIVVFNVSGVGNYTIGDAAEVTSCGTLDRANTVYTLQNDVYSSGTCFVINANNITLDGNGYNITGDGIDYGIYGQFLDNITVKNFVDVYFFNHGVLFEDSSRIYLINSSITSNTGEGVYYYATSNGIINNVVSNSNGNTGIILTVGSSGNTILNSNFSYNAGSGIGISISSNYNNISGVNSTGASIQSRFTNIVNSTISTDGFGSGFSSGLGAVNDTTIIDSNIEGYSMPQLATFSFRNSSYGEITFLRPILGSGSNLIGNYTSDLVISDNLVSIVPSSFNKPANITIYNGPALGAQFVAIYKNGAICSDCYNFTPLDGSTVVFNVTGAGNYTVRDTQNLTSCTTLNQPNRAYHFYETIYSSSGNCFVISADNITLNGHGNYIVGSVGSGSASIYASGVYGAQIINVKSTGFDYGIRLENSNNSVVSANTIESFISQGIQISNGKNNRLIGNDISGGNKGIVISGISSENILQNNRIYSISSIQLEDLSGSTRKNYLIYNNSYGRIEWKEDILLYNLTTDADLILGTTIWITSENVGADSSEFLGNSRISGASANITLYNVANPSGYYPIRLHGIADENNLRCTSCVNYTNLTGTVMFSVPSVTGNYSIDRAPASVSEVKLSSGWNLVSLTTDDSQTGNVSIALSPGRNLIGFSSGNSTLLNASTIRLPNGTVLGFNEAVALGEITKFSAYVDQAPGQLKFKYNGIDEHYLNESKGYELYSNKSSNITLVISGSSARVGDSYAWADLMFRDDLTGEVRNINQAAAASWVSKTLRYLYDGTFDGQIDSINSPEDGLRNYINSWEGIFIESNRNNITLLRQD